MFPLRTSVRNREIPGAVIALIVANIAVYTVQAGLPAEPAIQFIREYGLTTDVEVTSYTRAGGGCGSCRPDLRELLDRAGPK